MRNLTLLALLLGLCAPLTAQQYTFKHSSLPCLNKTFTIVVHVFPDSLGRFNMTEATVRQALDNANPFFAPICARFEICEFRYHENWQYDTLRRPNEEIPEITTKYNVERRINLYLVGFFTYPYDECGLTEIGGIGNPVSSYIVLRKDCINARALAHELGHFFSLKNTFEGSGVELVDGSNCTTAGDGICDTPADPYVPGEPLPLYVSPQCVFINQKQDATGKYYNPDLGNIMSYYQCDTCGFTWGQLTAMAQAYLASAIKFW